MSTCYPTRHAVERMRQRAVTAAAVQLVLEFGMGVRGPGVRRIRMDKRALAAASERGAHPSLMKAARGVVVVVADGATVITVWRGGPAESEPHQMGHRRARRRVAEECRLARRGEAMVA